VIILALLLLSMFSALQAVIQASGPLGLVSINLQSRETDWSTSNLGTMTFDPEPWPGYSLPTTIQRETAPFYQVCYYPPSRHVHDHWETSGGIELVPPQQFPESPLVSVKVTGPGTMIAVYVEIFDVNLESREDNGATSNLGEITLPYPGTPRSLPTTANVEHGTEQAMYYPASGYVIDHWETSGGVSVPDPYVGELTSVTVDGSGTLRAIYKAVLPPNNPPFTPTTPEWVTTERVLLEGENTGFRSAAIDPDNDNVKITFDWGDGTADTSNWVSSGSFVEQDHSWNIPGMFEVRTKATDNYDPPGESPWSLPLEVTVVTIFGSGDWAGYIVQSPTEPITSVEGSWIVPEFGTELYGRQGIWVGIGGYGHTNLIQTGIATVTRPDHETYYYAFYETWPGLHISDEPDRKNHHIFPRDMIWVKVSESQSMPGRWRIEVKDLTQGWTWVEDGIITLFPPDQTTAEWILELGGGSTNPASSFTSIDFTSAMFETDSTLYELGNVWQIDGVDLLLMDQWRGGVGCTIVSTIRDYGNFEIQDSGNRPPPLLQPITSISLFSSADLHIYDSLGNHLGYNSTSGFIDIQIPNSIFFEDEEVQYALLFNPDEYQIDLVGEENGDFHLHTQTIANETITLDQWINETITIDETKTYYLFHQISLQDLTNSKTVVGQGYNCTISIVITNQGNYTENFNVTAYADATIIGTQLVNLASGALTIITFTWNTTGFAEGNYTISGYATALEGETQIEDNNFTDGWVFITIAGDVTSVTLGVPDGIVNMRDIGALCDKFMTSPANPEWNPNMDINDDGTVNMRDISIACDNFMKTFE